MPASYVAGGHAVDLSSAFSTLYAVSVTRAYVTSTKASDGRIYKLVETGTDTLANRKFRVFCEVPRAALTPSGTNSAPTFTGASQGSHTHTYDKANTPVSSTDVITGAGTSPHAHNVSHTSTASGGATPATPSGTVSAPTFTGNAVAQAAAEELTAGTNLSTVTVEFVALGVV